jgi:lipoyl(octanoyl) transferase
MDTPALRVIDLGLRGYEEVWRLQLATVEARQRDEVPDTLLLVEHPHVITLGRAARKENLLAPEDIPVFAVERGGDVTYHGPGQLVGYPILRLAEHERDLKRYLRGLEEAIIRTAAELGVPAGRQEGATGVWSLASPPQKLASLGVAVKRGWVTYHGLALNVATDLTRFAAINPCGFEASVMTSICALLGRPIALGEVKPILVAHLAGVFAREPVGDDEALLVG